MSDSIGPISVPEHVPSGTFPLVTRWPVDAAQARSVRVHRFGSANAKIEQRYIVGDGAVRYRYRDAQLSQPGRILLRDFYDARKGPEGAFTYRVPNPDGTFTNTTVCFENAALSAEHLSEQIVSTGITMVAIPDPTAAPVYAVASTCERFPSGALATALLAQEQEIIPLVKLRVADGGVSDIYLSDRRCTVGGHLYLPRLLRIGDEGSEELLSQSIDADDVDQVKLAFGNADQVLTDLANATELMGAWVELSFYHVGTGILLNLWAGELVHWSDDAGAEFQVECSDRLSALTVSAPAGTCSRVCARRFKLDGCPFGPDTRDLVHFPSASLTTCDYGYNTPNGCMAHGVQTSYKGVYRVSQTAKIKDNSSGTFGIGRSLFSSTSQVSDTLEGKPLPEIWHDDDGIPARGLPVQALLAAGREEGDFYDGIGIVGAGPLDAYTTPGMYDADGDGKKETFLGATLDGQPHHGLKVDSNGNPVTGDSTAGLRQVLGSDPAGGTDYFSMGRSGTGAGWVTGPDGSPMHEVTGGGSAYNEIYSAGVAFVELRRADAKGIQLTLPDTHEMRVMVAGGLTGYTWSAPGSRSAAARCTNPFWVAVNSLLRWLGAGSAAAGTQETYFDVASAIACGTIADATVAKIFGSGTEKQFRFKGTIRDGKPARSALREILNSGLGYFTWSFGKLRLGCRINASAVSAYTSGNMIFDSLQLRPLAPEFEQLTVEFDDEEYLFARNTVPYIDKDYAASHRRAGAPRSVRQGALGCTTKSAAARLAIVRCREELGGIDATEQAQARSGTFATTLLGLENQAGDVISIADGRLPGGSQKFQVRKWRLMRDFSIAMDVACVRDSMYDVTVGPKPKDVAAAPIPVEAARDQNKPPSPAFGVDVDAMDPLSLDISGIAFSDPANTHSISAARFRVYYTDPAAPDYLVGTALTSGAANVILGSTPTTLAAGDYIQIGSEILLCGTPSGSTVPITRAQLGSPAASASVGALVQKIFMREVTAAFAPGAFDGGDSGDWTGVARIPETKVAAVRGWVSNAYGDSAVTDVCTTGNASHGIPLTAPPAGGTARAVVNVTNANATLSAGPQLVNVIATSVDCIITFPPNASMPGDEVMVWLSPGSTHQAVCRWHSGDTGQGASADYPVVDPGASVTFIADGAGDWKLASAPNSSTAGPVADAPNVLNTSSAAAVYGQIDNASAYGYSWSIDLPTSDPDYAAGRLKKIHVVRVRGGHLEELATLYAPWASSPVTGDTGAAMRYVQDGSAHTDTVEFLVENDAGVISSSPVSKSVTVRASAVTSVTGAEVGTPEPDPITRLVSTFVDIAPVLNGNQVPQNVTLLYSEDAGANWTYVGWKLMSSVVQAFRIKRPKPGANANWQVAALAGAAGGDPSVKIASANLATQYPGVAVSSSFTVAGLALPAANAITTASVGLASNVIDGDGHQSVEIPGVTWTDPTDTNAAFTRITVQCVDASGNPAPSNQGGTEVPFFGPMDAMGDVVQAGKVRTTKPLRFDYNPAGSVYTYMQYRQYAMNRNATATADWSDASKSVLQASAWSGAAFKRVNFGSLPAGVIPGTRVLDVPAPAVGSMALSCPISNGATTPSGVITYCWDGTLTNLPTDPNYAGCEITVQYAGSAEGGAFAKLTPTQTTFHNGDWPRPAANIGVTFRAYPVSRDGVRGTPAVYATTVTAAAAYVAPTITPPSGTGFALSLTIFDGPKNAAGQDQYYWSGFITPPTTLTNFDKVEMTQQWNSDSEGGVYATYPSQGSSPILFRSDNYYSRPVTTQVCTFRAYPAAKDGSRGTPVVVTRQILPATNTIPTGGSALVTEDFESGDFRDWVLAGIGGWAVSNSSPITGTYSARSTPQAYNIYFYKDFAAQAGASFIAKLKYKSSGAAGSHLHVAIVFWSVAGGGFGLLANNDVALAPSVGATEVVIGPYTAPAGTVDMRLQIYQDAGSSGNYSVDDISISASGGGLATIISSPITGLPTAANPNLGASILNDWDFSLSALGQLPYAAPIWRFLGSTVIADDGAGLGHYCRITGDPSVSGGLTFVEQTVPAIAGQQITLVCRCRSSNTGGTHRLFVGINWYDAAHNFLGGNYAQTSGYVPSWANSTSLSYVGPAGSAYALMGAYVDSPGGYWDVSKFLAKVI